MTRWGRSKYKIEVKEIDKFLPCNQKTSERERCLLCTWIMKWNLFWDFCRDSFWEKQEPHTESPNKKAIKQHTKKRISWRRLPYVLQKIISRQRQCKNERYDSKMKWRRNERENKEEGNKMPSWEAFPHPEVIEEYSTLMRNIRTPSRTGTTFVGTTLTHLTCQYGSREVSDTKTHSMSFLPNFRQNNQKILRPPSQMLFNHCLHHHLEETADCTAFAKGITGYFMIAQYFKRVCILSSVWSPRLAFFNDVFDTTLSPTKTSATCQPNSLQTKTRCSCDPSFSVSKSLKWS